MHRSISQLKHHLDATLCRFYFCRVTLHVSGVKRLSSGVLKTGTAAPGTGVIVAGRSSHHHIRDETKLGKIKLTQAVMIAFVFWGNPVLIFTVTQAILSEVFMAFP